MDVLVVAITAIARVGAVLSLAFGLSVSVFDAFALAGGADKAPETLADVPQGRILGVDRDGVPIVCGTLGPAERAPVAADAKTLPEGTRCWEAIPGVIRDDGVDSFRLEVDTNGPVARVVYPGPSFYFTTPEPAPFELRDDGTGEDRVAGDYVFTAGPFRWDTSRSSPDHFAGDPASPEGIFIQDPNRVVIEETDGTETQFLLDLSVGIVAAAKPATAIVELASDVFVSPHVVNVVTSSRETQRSLRFVGSDLSLVTGRLYDVLPDSFDFIVFFSTHRLERLPRTATHNFYAGLHRPVQNDASGIGRGSLDNSASWGSQGRLLAVCILDAYDRGIKSNNVTHEILHQWAAFLDPALGLTDGTAHFRSRSSIGSLVGGFAWSANGDGSYTVECAEGRNGAHLASPLDRYLAGFSDGSEVGPLATYDENVTAKCLDDTPVLPEEIVADITLADIQARHGPREPGPDEAQRSFRVGFVCESDRRPLNATEMTFYETLAEHYARALLPEDPTPYHGSAWSPVTRFFGDGVDWSTAVPCVYAGEGEDCNDNGLVDVCDIEAGRSTDCNGNLVPDECETVAGPAILAQPESIGACDGQLVTFAVEVADPEAVTCQWRKDGVDIPGAIELVLELTFGPSPHEQLGDYDVVVTNACGSTVSDPATLTRSPPPSIVTQPEGREACHGDDVELSVQVELTGEAEYLWRKDGAELSGESGATLTIESATVADGGVYDVVVTSACGEVVSDTATLVVLDRSTGCQGGMQVGGDCNQDADVNLADVICLLERLFGDEVAPMPCGDGAGSSAANAVLLDWNGDDSVDISDPVSVLLWLFAAGSPHAAHAGGASCIAIAGCPDVCD